LRRREPALSEETTADAGESVVDLEEIFADPGETLL
jgi:hypothetical protein